MQINRMGKNEFSFFKWLGFIVAVIVSIISAVLGYLDETPSQLIILYTVGIFGLIVWGWHHLSVRWIYNEKTLETEKLLTGRKSDNEISEESEHDLSYFSILVKNNRLAIIGILAMIIVFIALAFGMKDFLQWQNVTFIGGFFPHTFSINCHQHPRNIQQKRSHGISGAYWTFYYGFINC